MYKNLLGEMVFEPWEQEVADNINKAVKEIIEKEINKVFHNFKFKKKGEHLN